LNWFKVELNKKIQFSAEIAGAVAEAVLNFSLARFGAAWFVVSLASSPSMQD
jgi:hypothetical protein